MPKPHEHTSATDLATAVRAGDRRALAQAVSRLEMAADAPLIAALAPWLGRACIIGLTGAPGAGKSSLVNALMALWRGLGLRIAVIAVDPSSPVSRGAILGDRLRFSAALDDDGVYVRSLAAQGHLGGISPAAVRIIDVLDAAGFDLILIETVGTGQSEVDIAEIADVRVVIAAPGLGDGVQAMKAGLLEIADLIVVNKTDRPGAAETMEQLASALRLQAGREDVKVVGTSATLGSGVADLAEELRRIAAAAVRTPALTRRRRRARYLIAQAAVTLARARVAALDPGTVASLTDRVLAGDLSSEEAGALAISH